jgi:outer membrane protein assembly factor BamB
MSLETKNRHPVSVRWRLGFGIALLSAIGIIAVRLQDDWPFQKRNLTTQQITAVTVIALLFWWTFLSRAPERLRLGVTYSVGAVALLGALLFRLGGMSGDMAPILEFRWAKPRADVVAFTNRSSAWPVSLATPSTNASFPQFYGPNRDGVLSGVRLATNWSLHPPQVVWRKSMGAGWSGFAIVGAVCLGQEQRGSKECVIARRLDTGDELWVHTDEARYDTIIGGEGPRATPTVMSNRVFTQGATGILNCLDLRTGAVIWSRDVVKESGGNRPEWGASSSPLIVNDLVIVHGGEGGGHSLLAFRLADGLPVWKTGNQPGYASPMTANLAGTTQVISFNDGSIAGYDPALGATLWERPWGNGNVVCASPLLVSSNRVLFSSGYGVGAELLEISHLSNGTFAATTIWKSSRLKAKFAHMFLRTGCVFGLDDGILACVDLADGSQRWKEGRYGHGQGLLLGDLYLLMAESGELVLLRPTVDGPGELARFRVFHSKTWNPIALSGDLLVVRNDREAACLRVKLGP